MTLIFNYCEALLWFALGLVVALAARRLSPPGRRNGFSAAIALVIFGVSDLIEAQTGAWWRPWWLFALKAACVAVLLYCLFRHRALRRCDGTTDQGEVIRRKLAR